MDITSPLYLAHQNGRKADSYLKKKCFDEAVECHIKASEWLEQAMALTRFPRCLESLKLQQDFHLRQTDIIRVKKVQFEIQKQLVLYKRKKMEKRSSSSSQRKEEDSEKDLQIAIFRTMEEADSLLGLLTSRGGTTGKNGGGSEGEVKADAGGDWEPTEVAPLSDASYRKRPKDDAAVMEELRTVNAQLRGLVTRLVAQLEASRSEVDSLRSRLTLYEPPDMIPDLAPLEMPHFDFSTI